ncbi:MAG: ATP-binding protein [Bacillota bacterium]
MGDTERLRILHVEDDEAHAELIARVLHKSGLHCDISLAMSRRDYLRALETAPPDLILSDNHGLDFEGLDALKLARQRHPAAPFMFVSASFGDRDVAALKAAGASACLLKSDVDGLTRAVRSVLAQKQARDAPLDFRRLFEASPDVLLVLLPDAPRYTIVGATRARLEATHTEKDQFGRGLFEVFPDNPDDPAATGTSNLRASLDRVMATRAADTMAVQKYDIRGEDGRFVSKYWSPKNIPVLSDTGEILYILHRVEEVTELVQATEAGKELQGRTREMEREVVKRSLELAEANSDLREANVKLGELDAAKTVFFSNISHEFRTPLTLLLGPLEDVLARPPASLPEGLRENLKLAHDNAQRLLKLVNALLDFSRLEAGRVRATYMPTDLARRTQDLAGFFHSMADKAGLHLSVDCPPTSEPAYVDTEMWEKIVLNLLSNAFKYTLEGDIGVRLREEGACFVLEVEDTGTGIPADQLPRVFERFYRVQGAQSRSHEGSGIGLSLVQELVKLHGGTVSVASKPGHGTTFTVCIPKGAAHLPSDALGAPAAPGVRQVSDFAREVERWLPARSDAVVPEPAATTPSRGCVLLADDNAELRTYVSQMLKPYYQVELAVDGEEALLRALESPPDLVLSDVMMPRRDGFGLLRALREDPRTRNVPIILLSARAGEEASIEGLDAGADDYLIKPFPARELLARVRTHLELARTRRQWARELEQINRELEAFSTSVSHDLRGPLRSISGFAALLEEEYGEKLDDTGRKYLDYVIGSTRRMAELVEDLLKLARVTRAPLHRRAVDLTALAQGVVGELRRQEPERRCEVDVAEGLAAEADAGLVSIVLENLLSNAWKFSSKRADACIAVGAEEHDGALAFFVRDNGAGFDMERAGQLFVPFQRLHSEKDFGGTGIGLATVQRIVARHGGRVWAEAAEGRGATFFFTLEDRR